MVNLYYQDEHGEFVQVKEIKDIDITLDDDAEVLISPEPIEVVCDSVISIDLRKLMPLGYRNAEILKRDGYLSPGNGDLS